MAAIISVEEDIMGEAIGSSKPVLHYIQDQHDQFVFQVKHGNVLSESHGPETKFSNILEAKLRVDQGQNCVKCESAEAKKSLVNWFG